jgi:hypothetical protein
VDIVSTALGVLLFAVLLPASVAWSILRRPWSSQAASVPHQIWYSDSDPTGRQSLRYWDGAAWTDYVSDGGSQTEDPIKSGA